MHELDNIPLFVVAGATLIAAVTDIWKFKVYNLLTFPTLLAGLVVSTWLGGVPGLCSSLLGAVLGFGTLVLFFAAGGVGAGDVKLLTAIGAWLGPFLTYQVFVAAALAAGIYALVLVVLRGGLFCAVVELSVLWQRMLSPGTWERPKTPIETEVKERNRRRLVPFAAMTCLGFFATIAWWHSQLNEVWPPYHPSHNVSVAAITVSERGDSR